MNTIHTRRAAVCRLRKRSVHRRTPPADISSAAGSEATLLPISVDHDARHDFNDRLPVEDTFAVLILPENLHNIGDFNINSQCFRAYSFEKDDHSYLVGIKERDGQVVPAAWECKADRYNEKYDS